MDAVRNKLRKERGNRPRPGRDTKILTDWNGLMIAALSLASRAFDIPAYYERAAAAMRFLLGRLRQADGGLLHRYCDEEAAIGAFTDDYAFVIRGLIELYQTSFDPAWLQEALVLNQYLHRHFSGPGGAGFFTTSDQGENLIARTREMYDGAVPSGNSVMLGNLVLLGHLTGDPVHEEQASRLADAVAGQIRRSPSSFCQYLCGLDHLLGPAADIVITGDDADPVARDMTRLIRGSWLPSLTLQRRWHSQANALLDTLAPFTRTMTALDNKPTAYVCSGRTCHAPVTTPGALQELLEKK